MRLPVNRLWRQTTYSRACAPAARPPIALAAQAILLLSLILASPSAGQPHSGDVTGVWIDHTGQGAIEIAPCGAFMCGHVVWLKNPDHKSNSGRPICGTQIIGDLHKAPNNVWDSGWIYDPERDMRFSIEIELKNEATLLVTGYLGIKLLGETFTWKRAPATFRERCAHKR